MSLSRRRIAGWALFTSTLGLVSLAASIARCEAIAAEAVPDAQNDASALASDPLPPQVNARRAKIQAAIEHAPTDEWSAEYYEGDGEGENMLVSVDKNAGVAATWRGCLGLYGANEGSIDTSTQGLLAFHFEMPNGKPGESGIGTFPEKVHPVRWSQRRYLIAEDRDVDFVNAIHHGFEPRDGSWGMFLLARGDENKPVSGLPDLPASLLALIRKKPLVLRTAHVDVPLRKGRKDFPICVYRLHFELPPGETLVKGMTLRKLDDLDYRASTVEVTQVDAATVTAEVREYDACEEVASPPQPGWRYSTGAYPPALQR